MELCPSQDRFQNLHASSAFNYFMALLVRYEAAEPDEALTSKEVTYSAPSPRRVRDVKANSNRDYECSICKMEKPSCYDKTLIRSQQPRFHSGIALAEQDED